MNEISSGDKTQILLKLLDEQTQNIVRSEQQEQSLFQWTTSLLLASFGVIVALAEKSSNLSAPALLKLIASTMIVVPVVLSIQIYWIRRRSRRSVKNAEVIDNLQRMLHAFDEQFFGTTSPYPKDWKGELPKTRKQRRTPTYYTVVIAIMAVCVVATIWLIL